MKPGDVVESWGEDGNGLAVVVATSRHRGHLAGDEARELLLAEAVLGTIGRVPDLEVWRPVLDHANTWRWYRVTKREIDTGAHECSSDYGCAPGAWCVEGQGAGWVEVVGLTNNRIYDREAELADQAAS